MSSMESAESDASWLPRGAASSMRRSMNQRPAGPKGLLARYTADITMSWPSGGSSSTWIIANRCGFSSAELLRRRFVRHFKIAPSQYRKHFRMPTAAQGRGEASERVATPHWEADKKIERIGL